jgi:hypothetical protein
MFKKRKWLWAVPVAGAVGLGVGADRWLNAGPDKDELKPSANLPVTRVVLFSSGVGYFSRSGEVEGDARVDLRFPESDVNDLLKSLTLQDMGGGRVAAVSYDSREPLSRMLASFAVNLDGNPSLANILDQTRGQPVEVTAVPTAGNQPGRLQGKIVGIEHQKVTTGKDTVDTSVLNLWCADGMRSVKLSEVQAIRFSDPALESEVRRALDELARSKDSAKKAVSLHFAGAGRREVRVGYVVEAPVWKTSYRLVLDPEGGKPYLQGWAIVENPTDDDWSAVRMALVSGRPISFKMDLYNPLYVPRPVVEPERFASLRPPTYDGGFRGDKLAKDLSYAPPAGETAAARRSGAAPMAKGAPMAPGRGAGVGGGGFGANGAADGSMRLAETADRLSEQQRKQHAAALGAELAGRMDLGQGVGSAATGNQLGDSFQYVIDHPVTLGRQKSALLPIVGKDVEAARVSIYNPAVQPKHPLLGLRLKNTTGLHLSQGPITVFEGSTYAGDTRILDVTPNDDRLISYAIDLGTEVIVQNGSGSSRITNVKAVKGIVTTTTKVREEKVYKIANKGQQDRTLLVEHPNRTNQQFKVVDTDKPSEETAAFYRFTVPVKTGEEKTFTVKEERDIRADVSLTNSPDDQIRYFMSLNEATPALKQKLGEALTLKGTWDGHRRELAQVVADLQRLNQDQDRIRKNLRETPPQAEVYKTYLTKLSDQEKEIDGLTAKQKKLMGDEFAAKKSFEDYLSKLTD